MTQKLYTEEQVIEIVLKSRETGLTAEYLILANQGIELPSDEEIYNKCSDWVFRENPTKWSVNDDTAGDNMNSFAHGAKWMRDKIQGGNK